MPNYRRVIKNSWQQLCLISGSTFGFAGLMATTRVSTSALRYFLSKK